VSRVVGILGAAHSGSTALGLVLGGLPSVEFLGEDFRLATQHISDEVPQFPCATCGTDCPVFSRGVVLSAKVRAAEATGRWWPFLAGVVGNPDVIVSSDKRPLFFDNFGLPDHALVVYRERDKWADSWTHKHRGTRNVDDAAWHWDRLYGRVRTWCVKRGVPFTDVNWSEMRRDPKRNLAALAAKLGLQWTDAALDWTGRHHVQGYDAVGERMQACE